MIRAVFILRQEGSGRFAGESLMQLHDLRANRICCGFGAALGLGSWRQRAIQLNDPVEHLNAFVDQRTLCQRKLVEPFGMGWPAERLKLDALALQTRFALADFALLQCPADEKP